MIEPIDGGVTAAAGFRAAGTACGIKPEGLDVALIVCDAPASAAGLFTTNLTRAAPVTLSVEHLARTHGVATAIVVNSGCANACTGEPGVAVAREMGVGHDVIRAIKQALDPENIMNPGKIFDLN